MAPAIGKHYLSTAKDVMDHFRKTPRKVILTVQTTYLPPTENDGSRFSATVCDSHEFDYVHMNYELTTSENHLAAAMAVITSHMFGSYTLLSYDSVHNSASYFFTFEACEW